MVIHADIPLGQSLNETFFSHTTLVGGCVGEDVTDGLYFLVRDGDSVAVHPPAGDGEGLRRAQVEKRPLILGSDQLPGASHQVQTNNLSAVKCPLERMCRRLAGAHRHCPPHHAVLLCLHRTHVADYLDKVIELRGDELLVEKPDGNRIHLS